MNFGVLTLEVSFIHTLEPEIRHYQITRSLILIIIMFYTNEIKYPTWFSNIVMMKKSSCKWSTCVDFTDIDMVFSNNLYHIPNIDKLIEEDLGYKMLNFIYVSRGSTKSM